MEVSSLLKEWGLEDLIETFKEHEIDLEAFSNLEESMINELVLKIGKRSKFLRKWRLFTAPVVLYSSLDDNNTEKPSTSRASTLTIENMDTDSFRSPTSTPTDLTYESTAFYSQEATVGLTEQELQNTPVAKYRKSCAEKVRDILNKSQKGKMILSAYMIHNALESSSRDSLAELLIQHEIQDNADNRINREAFEEYAKGIISIFPTECKETYFSLNRKRAANGRVVKTGSGKLFRKFYNTRKQMKVAGLLSSPRSSKGSMINNDANYGEEIHAEYMGWLKNQVEPWSTVVDYWEKTYSARKRLLEEGTIYQYLQSFPCLKKPLAYTLFENDFNKMHDNLEFYTQWQTFSANIVSYAKTLKNSYLMEQIENIDKDGISTEERNNRILLLIPHLIKPTNIKKMNKTGIWKPSRLEVAEAFVIHIKTIGELHNTLEARRSKLEKLGLTFQPTPVFVGELENIIAAYVVVDDILLEVPTGLGAVNLCFQVIHALHTKYPLEAEQVWMVLQLGLYAIKTEFDQSYVAVNAILASLSAT